MLLTLSHYSCFDFGVETTSVYTSPVYNNEVLVLHGDTTSICGAIIKEDRFHYYDTYFLLFHLNFDLEIRAPLPKLDSTVCWTNSNDSTYIKFYYLKEQIKTYTIYISRLPYTSKTIGSVPKGNMDKNSEIIDSIAFKIECVWGENNAYSSTIQALKYIVFNYD
jgi:hypothetical protein